MKSAVGIAVLVTLLAPVMSPARDKLVWSDEFNGPAGAAPDPAKWTYDLGGGGWGNDELETYTKTSQNVAQDGAGHLVIRALRTESGYTSARLKTQGKFVVTYGRVAVRMKIPQGQGMWPAFWMLGSDIAEVGWPKCGEIDVMENIGKEPSIVHGTIHGPGYSGSNGVSHQYSLPANPALSDHFHIYAVDWKPDSITFSLDGHPYATVTPNDLPHGTEWVYKHPFFLLLNLAVGGAWPGNPDTATRFPASLVVDWVRVFRTNPSANRP